MGGLLFSVIRPTGWLREWGSGLNSSYDFHCAGFYPPVNQEQKNEKQELAVTGGRTPVLGVLPAFSCLGRFLPRGGEGTQMTTGQSHSQHRQGGHCSYAGYSIMPVTQNLLRWKPQKGQGHLRLPHSPDKNHVGKKKKKEPCEMKSALPYHRGDR